MKRMSRWCLLALALAALGGCTISEPRPLEEQLARQVVFTIANEPPFTPELYTVFMAGSYSALMPELVKERTRAMAEDILRYHQLRKVSQWSIKSIGVDVVVAEIRGNKKTVDAVVAELSTDDRIDMVQTVNSYSLLTYNDPYFEMQNSVRGDDIENIHRLATGKDVVVGIVDTGLDRLHPELSERIIYSRNHVAHDPLRFDLDEHGTAVAGIIGSSANNQLGIVGVAPDVKFMAFKACWEKPGTRVAVCDSVSLIRALTDVIDRQPDIVNLSLAGPKDPLIERLLRAADHQGIVLVAAVDGRTENSFPASMPEVIAVGTPLGNIDSADNPGILAPGTDVLTTTPGATYAFKSGSSMATAYVSGIAALMKERQPTLSGEQIRLHLRNTSHQVVGAVPVVDMCNAIRRDGENCEASSLVMVTE